MTAGLLFSQAGRLNQRDREQVRRDIRQAEVQRAHRDVSGVDGDVKALDRDWSLDIGTVEIVRRITGFVRHGVDVELDPGTILGAQH